MSPMLRSRAIAFGRFIDHEVVHVIVDDETRQTACGFRFPRTDNPDLFEIEPVAPMYRDICGSCEDELTTAIPVTSPEAWRPSDAR